MLTGRDIVCVGFADWDTELATNQHHLMRRLAGRNRVLFVESLGLRRPQLRGRDVRRMIRRLRTGLTPPRRAGDLHVLSPLVLPLHASAPVRAVNARLLDHSLRRAVRRLALEAPVLWAYVPQAEALIEPLRPSLVVYHCVDDIAAQPRIHGESFRAAEQRFVARADLVLASSPALLERMRRLAPKAVFSPNVADCALFSRALDPGPIDTALARLPRPRIVFTGAIVSTKLDFELLVDLARLRRDWSLALVGPVGAGDPATDVSRLRAEPNVHLLGLRAYDELPEVLRGADAGLIPYALNRLTSSIFPMKVYEYLAAGLPVVSTPLPALEGVDGVVAAATATDTAAQLAALIAADDEQQRRRRSELAQGHSWDARLDEIASWIEALETESLRAAG